MDEWKWRRTSVALVQCKGGDLGIDGGFWL